MALAQRTRFGVHEGDQRGDVLRGRLRQYTVSEIENMTRLRSRGKQHLARCTLNGLRTGEQDLRIEVALQGNAVLHGTARGA